MGDINWNQLLFSFEGRINRGKFWGGAIAIYVVLGVMLSIVFAVLEGGGMSVVIWPIFGAVYVLMIWSGFALSIKRWHDRDKSGWWMLIVLIPFIGGLWALIETGFMEGTKGDNTYGPDPLAGA